MVCVAYSDTIGAAASGTTIVTGGGTSCDASTGDTLFVVPWSRHHSFAVPVGVSSVPRTLWLFWSSIYVTEASDVTGSSSPRAAGVSKVSLVGSDLVLVTTSGMAMVAGGGMTWDAVTCCAFLASMGGSHVTLVAAGVITVAAV